jgi:signal transduction histidine kinase
MKHKLRNVDVVREYDEDLPKISARGSELNQVWTNLIDNAVDAMQDKGTLWLITREENDFVMVEVADDGPGIPPDVQARMFEPFYTTKQIGTGTGLGLDIVYRIVKGHNGTIEAQSEPGHTRFIVRLPLGQDDSTRAD